MQRGGRRDHGGEPCSNIRTTLHGDLKGEWDPARLRQLLSNIIGNAVQHGSAGGTVKVVVDGAGPAVQLSISNEGEPIPKDLIERIFEPLTRGISPQARNSARVGSMGLGLYIAREVITAHGGAITVESEPGQTTFRIILPRRVPG